MVASRSRSRSTSTSRSRSRLRTYAIVCARMAIPSVLIGELYLHVFAIAPVVYGIGWAYCVYLTVVGFVVVNAIANIVTFVLTDTSVLMDSCTQPELNVKLCNICDRNVPPRCTHCDHCNECIPRRRGHSHILGTCVGYFNHRYYFMAAVYCLFYSANAVAVSAIFYNRVLRNCERTATPIQHYPHFDEYEDCEFLLFFFLSAFVNFFILIFAIILLTIETEVVITGKMRHETRVADADAASPPFNYDRGLKKNLICMLGRRWYLACLCPAIKSTLPDMHAVLFCVGDRPFPFASRF